MRLINYIIILAFVTNCNYLAQTNESSPSKSEDSIVEHFLDEDGKFTEGTKLYLSDIARESRIIGIGESIHGSDGYHNLARQTVMHLVEAEQYRLLGAETFFLNIVDIINPMLLGERAFDSILAEKAFPYGGKEVVKLIENLIEYNAKNTSDPVLMFGFDFKDGVANGQKIINWILKVISKENKNDIASELQNLKSKCAWMSIGYDYFKYLNELELEKPSYQEIESQHSQCQISLDNLSSKLRPNSLASREDKDIATA